MLDVVCSLCGHGHAAQGSFRPLASGADAEWWTVTTMSSVIKEMKHPRAGRQLQINPVAPGVVPAFARQVEAADCGDHHEGGLERAVQCRLGNQVLPPASRSIGALRSSYWAGVIDRKSVV